MRGLEPDEKRGFKRDDLIGFAAAAGCFLLSEFDPGWGLFWFSAGVLLIVWSLASIYRDKSK